MAGTIKMFSDCE